MTLVGGPDSSEKLRAIEATLGPLPVHVSAGGRAILSRLPEATRREVLDRALRRYTPQSLTDPKAVLAEVAKAKRDGYAVTRGEFQADVSVVAAAVLDARLSFRSPPSPSSFQRRTPRPTGSASTGGPSSPVPQAFSGSIPRPPTCQGCIDVVAAQEIPKWPIRLEVWLSAACPRWVRPNRSSTVRVSE